MIGSIIRGIVNAIISPLVNALFNIIVVPILEFVISCFLPLFLSVFLIIASLWLWYFGMIAAIQAWQIVKLEIILAFTIGLVNELIAEELIIPQIEILAEGFKPVLPLMFNVALTVLGITYVLAAFWVKQLNLVDWKRAIAWLLAGIFFYTYTAELFTSFEVFRRGAGNFVYQIVLQLEYDPDTSENPPNWAGITYNCIEVESGLTDAVNVFERFAGEDATGTDEWGCLTDWFGGTTAGSNNDPDDVGTELALLKYDQGIDAVDVTFAFVLADPTDLLLPLPLDYFTYFFIDNFITNFLDYAFGIGDPDSNGVFIDLFTNLDLGSLGGDVNIDLEGSIDIGVIGSVITAWGRMFAAQFLGLIAILEQIVYVIFTTGYGLVFWALMFFLPLAFFVSTEKFAMAAVKQFIEMFWSFLFSQFMIALGVGIMIAGAGLYYPPAIQAFAYIAACPAVVAVLTASNAFMGMIKGITSVISAAAAQGVEQGFQLTKQVAIAKAGAVGNNLGIAGADKAIGPGAGSSNLGSSSKSMSQKLFGDTSKDMESTTLGKSLATGFVPGAQLFSQAGRRRMMDSFSGTGTANSWKGLGKLGTESATGYAKTWRGLVKTGIGGIMDVGEAAFKRRKPRGKWTSAALANKDFDSARSAWSATKAGATRAGAFAAAVPGKIADGARYVRSGQARKDAVQGIQAGGIAAKERMKAWVRGDSVESRDRSSAVTEAPKEDASKSTSSTGDEFGNKAAGGGQTDPQVLAVLSRLASAAEALAGGGGRPQAATPQGMLMDNMSMKFQDLSASNEARASLLAQDMATLGSMDAERIQEVLRVARDSEGRTLSIDLKTNEAREILKKVAEQQTTVVQKTDAGGGGKPDAGRPATKPPANPT